MKKTISFVVAVALILSLAVTVFAAQPEPDSVESSSCSHDWGKVTTSNVWECTSDTQCKLTVIETKTCKKCAEDNKTIVRSDTFNHSEAIASATCDGTTQTHIYKCPNCHTYRYTRWVTCPGAGKSHVTGCFWLPV